MIRSIAALPSGATYNTKPKKEIKRNHMCGICGELNFKGNTPDLATLDRMRDKLISRGPNQSGIYSNGPLPSAIDA